MANAIIGAIRAMSKSGAGAAALDVATFGVGGAAIGGAKAALSYDPTQDNKPDRFTGIKSDMTQTPVIGRMRAAAEGAVSGAKVGVGVVAADRVGRGIGNAMMDSTTKGLMRPRGSLTERFVGGARAVGGANPATGDLGERVETSVRDSNFVRAAGSKQYKDSKEAVVGAGKEMTEARKGYQAARPAHDAVRAVAEEQNIVSQGAQAGSAAQAAHAPRAAQYQAYQQQSAQHQAAVSQHQASQAAYRQQKAAQAAHPSFSQQAAAAQASTPASAYVGPTPKQYRSGGVVSQGQRMAGPGTPYTAPPVVRVNKKAYRAQRAAARAPAPTPVANPGAAPASHIYTPDQQVRLGELQQVKNNAGYSMSPHNRPMGPATAGQQAQYDIDDKVSDLLKLDPVADAAAIQSRALPLIDETNGIEEAYSAAQAKFNDKMPGLKKNFLKQRRINKISSPADEKNLLDLGNSLGIGKKVGDLTGQESKNIAGMFLGDAVGIASNLGGMAVGGLAYGVKSMRHLHEESIMKPARENPLLTKKARIADLENEVQGLRSSGVPTAPDQARIDDRLEMIRRVKTSRGSLANPNVGSMSVQEMDNAGINAGMRRDLTGGLLVGSMATGALAFGTAAAIGSTAIGGPAGHPLNALGRQKDVIATARAQMDADASNKIRMSRPEMIGLNDAEEGYYVNQSLRPVRGRHTPGKYNDDGGLTLALSAIRRG